MTKRSIQFRYKDKVGVDLLVSPYWKNKNEFYKFLRDEVPHPTNQVIARLLWNKQNHVGMHGSSHL